MVATANSLHTDVKDTLLEFEDTLAELMGAKAALAEAQRDLASVQASLLHQRALLIAEGVAGNNAEVREANLRLELSDMYQEVFCLEAEVSRCKLRAEVDELGHTALKYRLRAFQVLADKHITLAR